ncbi:MAG: C25 family cysteine peptidase, partial [Bacteroidales bacterium]|nr:C25 family cysteine peptidase [Bacteroidales bacterium]
MSKERNNTTKCSWLVAAMMLVACLSAAGVLPVEAQDTGTGHAAHSVLRNGAWYRLAIPTTGIYGVTTDNVAELAGVSIGRVGVYGQPGGMLSESNADARPDDLPQLSAMVVDNNGNGVFDASDRLVFYAQGADAWRYGEDSLFHHERNGYDNHNYVFLRLDGMAKGVSTAATVAVQGEPIQYFDYRAVHDVDEVNTHEGGIVWVGERFSAGAAQRTITMTLPGVPRYGQVDAAYALASLSPSATFSVDLNGGGTTSLSFSKYKPYESRHTRFSVTSAMLNFNISYHSDGSGLGYLDYIVVNAQVPLRFQNGQTAFRSVRTTNGNATYAIANANGAMQVWDVTDYDSVVAVPITLNGSTASFTAPHDEIREYVAFDGSHYLSPSAVAAVECQDLHGQANPDMVIVANAAYVQQAQALASLHDICDNLSTLVVTDRQVFNEFSGGKQDPMALREMMRMFYKRHAQNNALPAPRYLLLFGKGSYDNRDILKHGATTVVTYVSQTSFSEDYAYSSDDLFGYLDDDETGETYESLDLSIGRLPAKSKAEADLFVKKITRYMTRADLNDSTQR